MWFLQISEELSNVVLRIEKELSNVVLRIAEELSNVVPANLRGAI